MFYQSFNKPLFFFSSQETNNLYMAQGILNWEFRPFLVGQVVKTETLVYGEFHI